MMPENATTRTSAVITPWTDSVNENESQHRQECAFSSAFAPSQSDLRIVSLLPSITEILAVLGMSNQIIGVTHCCDYPSDALRDATVVTTSDVRPAMLTQKEIHERVSGAIRRGDSLYALDERALKHLQPTHVFTQSLCDICAVSAPVVKSTCSRILNGTTTTSKIISLEPQTLSDVWETLRITGKELGLIHDRSTRIIDGYLTDLEEIRLLVKNHLTFTQEGRNNDKVKKPKVAFLEWHEPFVSGGHWIADMLEIAGANGDTLRFHESGQPSKCISDEDLLEYNPDVILIGPCGFTLERATNDTLPLLHHPTRGKSCWNKLRAVQKQRVYSLDGNAYYARPGPRLVQGAGLMAKCMYPTLEISERLAPPEGMAQIKLDMYTQIE